MERSPTDLNLTDERLSAYGRLIETQRRLHRLFDRSLRESVGITVVVYEALLRLARSPEGHLTINELGDGMDLSSGGATRLVDRLEAAGFVERIACPEDRRVSWAQLTDAGWGMLSEATRIHLGDLDEHVVGKLDRREFETLRDLLRAIRPADG